MNLKKIAIGCVIIFLLFICTVITVLIIYMFPLIDFFGRPYVQQSKTLKDRAFVIVVEDNDYIQYEDDFVNWYDSNKSFVDIFVGGLLNIPQKDLKNKKMTDLIDDYGEDYIGKGHAQNAKAYGKVVYLTDETATLSNFVKVIEDLSIEGYTVDVLLNLHGSTSEICSKNKPFTCDSTNDIRNAFKNKKVNLGFVYQTVCYGKDTMDVWIDVGAKVANGSKDLNSVVLIAPRRFIQNITSGQSFEDAVINGYNFKLDIYSRFYWLSSSIKSFSDALNSEASQMIFAGDKAYKIL